MIHGHCGLKSLLCGSLLMGVVFATAACGTLQVALNETATPGTPLKAVTATSNAAPTLVATAPTLDTGQHETPPGGIEVRAWYGQVHSVPGADPHYDYLKLWHLNLWPKFGRAVGIVGANPAIDAEIDRIRDRDVRATFWGSLICGVGDFGACQLRVTRISANDGGPAFDPEPVEGWEGTIGWLPAPPGNQQDIHYFILAGELPVLYGIASTDPTLQAELERLHDGGAMVRIWGELRSRVQPVTGSVIDVNRFEPVQATPSP